MIRSIGEGRGAPEGDQEEEEEEGKGRGRWGGEKRDGGVCGDMRREVEGGRAGKCRPFLQKSQPTQSWIMSKMFYAGVLRQGGPLQGSFSLLTLLFHLDTGKTLRAGLLYHAHAEQMPMT